MRRTWMLVLIVALLAAVASVVLVPGLPGLLLTAVLLVGAFIAWGARRG